MNVHIIFLYYIYYILFHLLYILLCSYILESENNNNIRVGLNEGEQKGISNKVFPIYPFVLHGSHDQADANIHLLCFMTTSLENLGDFRKLAVADGW